MDSIKQQLYQHCLDYANNRIATAESAITSAQDAATNDTKSSAGDKYETTREMMQQEISRNQIQLSEARKLKYQLSSFSISPVSDTVQAGSLVLTDNGNFFIAISAGQITINDITYLIISSFSPIGKLLIGKQIEEVVQFNERKFLIQSIF